MNERKPSIESDDDQHESDRVTSQGQINISTLLSWTAVICFLLVWMDVKNLDSNFFGNDLMLFAIGFGPPFTCIPFLIDRLLLKKDGLKFSFFWVIWLVFCVAIYSVLMLMLATVGFEPEWKGSKGLHWSYYMLDGAAGITLWPIYFFGAIAFAGMLVESIRPYATKRSVVLFFGPVICALISFWYTFAVLYMHFTTGQTFLAIVPGSVGICYALYSWLIWKNREFTLADFKASWRGISVWIIGLLVSLGIKIPLAKQIYDGLPDEMPEGCFIVTAATKGHQNVVHTWFDVESDRLLNQQLLTFWKFERLLKLHTPKFHWAIRQIYNRIGPVVARSIVFRWQADFVYLLLKPAEWGIRFCLLTVDR